MSLTLENVVIKPITRDNDVFVCLGVYADGKLILEIDEVSDDDTINLFFSPKNGAALVDSKPFQKEFGIENSEVTHELLWSRR